jgi:hypothetical protein
MLLEVRRELIPIGLTGGQWEQRPYSQVVWTHDGGARAFPITVPHDFALGLLTTYIDGTKVDLPIFDAALRTIGCTRLEIEQALAVKSA